MNERMIETARRLGLMDRRASEYTIVLSRLFSMSMVKITRGSNSPGLLSSKDMSKDTYL
jgi:hypothetical protein